MSVASSVGLDQSVVRTPAQRVGCLSVVLPAYNEASAIHRVILDHVQVLEKLRAMVPLWEIVCVDDASTDGTSEILQRLQRRVSRLRVIRHAENKGIFESFSRLYKEAKGTHVYSTGSDGQWPAENLEPLLHCLLAGADLVVGVRMNRRHVYSVWRQAVSAAFNFVPRVLFGVSTGDAGSVKLGKREIFAFELISRSPFVEAERIVMAHKRGYRVGFVPIRFGGRIGGIAKGVTWENIGASVRDVIKFWKKCATD